MTRCVRGCTVRKQHRKDCPVPDWHEQVKLTIGLLYGGWRLTLDYECPGCQPREATNGHLCTACHNRLAQWLSNGPNSLAYAWSWLEVNIGAGGKSATDYSGVGGGSSEPRSPLSVARYDARAQIGLRLSILLDELAQAHRLHGPDWWASRRKAHEAKVASGLHQHTAELSGLLAAPVPTTLLEVAQACQYLTQWLDRIEDDRDLVACWWRKLAEAMAEAHTCCPWRGKVTYCAGVECPRCQRMTLVIEAGDSDVTCRTCGEVYKRDVYDRWTSLLAYENEHESRSA